MPLVVNAATVAPVRTTAGALTAGVHNPVNTTGGALTVTLPASPGPGAKLTVSKYDTSANPLTITGNINGVASSSVVLGRQNQAMTFQYDLMTTSWWTTATPTFEVAHTHRYNVKDFGLKGGADPGDNAALQALINANAAATRADWAISPLFVFPPDVYALSGINLRSNQTFMSEGWTPAQGWREKSVRLRPVGIPDGGYMFTSTETGLGEVSMLGFSSTGYGTRNGTTGVFGTTNPKTGFLRLAANAGQTVHDCTFSGMYVENYGREALRIGAGGINRFFGNFWSGLFDPTYLTEARGAFDIGGADHMMAHNEFSGPGQFLTGPELYAAAAWIRSGASVLSNNVYQVGDVGCRYSGIANRMLGERFDHNAGHGFYGQGGYDLTATGCHLNRNNRNGVSQSYDHLHVPSNGTFWMSWENMMFGSFSAGGTQVRYNINDLRPDSTLYDNHYSGRGDETQIVRFDNIVSRQSTFKKVGAKKIVANTGTAHQLGRDEVRDNGRVQMSSASANTLTILPNASVPGGYPLDKETTVVQIGTGQTTFVEGAGVTILSEGDALKLRGQGAAATLTQINPNTWLLVGNLVA